MGKSFHNNDDSGALGFIRGFLLVIFLVGVLGSGSELLLMGHTEEFWQYIPLILMAASLAAVIWNGVRRGTIGIRAFQGIMILILILEDKDNKMQLNLSQHYWITSKTLSRKVRNVSLLCYLKLKLKIKDQIFLGL